MVSECQDVDVSCAFQLGQLREVEELLCFEPSSSGLLGIEKGALIEIVKGVFGLPDTTAAKPNLTSLAPSANMTSKM